MAYDVDDLSIGAMRRRRLKEEPFSGNRISNKVFNLLVDLGQEHLKEIVVELGLHDLQNMAHDVDDLSVGAMLRRRLKGPFSGDSISKVFKIVPIYYTNFIHDIIMCGCNMGSRIDEIEIMPKSHHLIEVIEGGLNYNFGRSNLATKISRTRIENSLNAVLSSTTSGKQTIFVFGNGIGSKIIVTIER